MGKIRFAKLNVLATSENHHMAARHGIMSTLTRALLLCQGRPKQGTIGLMSKSASQNLVNDVLNKYETCLEKSTNLRY